ncbi:hypothetical protein [Paenibacillus sp. Soil724D2]|uniref:hypothetical protein n=1 Tax=Paenibacillus sp. (strain Soil724D2) TaxID=1736392 RepID=UPI00071448F6|nr:hypothetical protein [Paenibacillus sp. Soil724D2]KRE33432.1 hypothetical protein ASG85_14290 [Paenibacillus sp. Soil724D2]
MYPVTQKYKDNIYATSRLNKGRVTFDLSDVSASSDVSSITTTSESALSLKAQMNNNFRSSTYRLATNEKDRFALDGSWSFADDTLTNNGEIGWVSDLIGDGTGTFTTPQQVTINFNANHTSIGLTVTFDPLNNEYATDFTIIAYDAGNAVIATYPYTGNTLVQVAAYGNLVNYRKVAVIINKWSVPNRRARVSEIDFGIVKQYTGELGLVSMQLTEEMDLTSGELPSPEFKFTVDNSSREFNILNPTGFYKSLQQKQQVVGEIGLTYDDGTIEWIPVGNYLLWEWQSDEGSLTATFFARTQLDVMASVNYENLTATTKSLYQFAVDIFALCGITNYSIDTALQSINTNSLVKKTNCKNVLQMIALAACANVYVTRSNVITIKANKTRKVRYVRDWLNGSTANTGNHWIEIQASDASGVNKALGKTVTSGQAGNLGVVTDGDVTSNNYATAPTGLSSVTLDLGAVFDIASVNVWHYWADLRTYHNTKTEISSDGVNWTTIFDSSVSGEYAESAAGRSYPMETVIETKPAVDTISMNDQYAEPRINLDTITKQVDVTYWTNLSTSAVTSAVAAGVTLGDTFKLDGNTLINDSTRASAVANWLLAKKNNNRAIYNANWRGNQAHEVGDVVAIGNSYGANMNAYVTRTELTYQGYVQASTEARGVAN